MNDKTLKTLEYYKIINLLEDKAESQLGKDMVRDMKPIVNLETIERLQEETNEAYNILVKRSAPPLFGIYDLESSINRVVKGGVLDPSSLLKVADSLRVCRRLKSYLKNSEGDQESVYPILESMIGNLEGLRNIEDQITDAIISEDEISDNASSTLRNIRRGKVAKNSEIRNKLNTIINSEKYSKVLQDNIITLREGRYVVPVKQDSKNNIKGIVHDMSSSGATVFIEPMSIVNLNNELRELDVKEMEEIQKILEQLSLVVLEKAEEIVANQKILQKLDFIFARGKLALSMEAIKPILNEEKYFNLKKARHPLLDKNIVVPTNIYMGKEFNTLVITGPNTGGKTVTLKTVGLLTLMAQSGLHIPADFNSEIGVFHKIFADIGDEQSIEQSLSTFSSHMTNIVQILEEIDEKSLVLFDELGAGTDPTEGAALAMAILDNLLTRDIRTLATTHYSQLKVYALTTEGVTNASVEFDVETLSPTYKLLIGVPGKSNAFDISKRLGLQNYIISSAKNLISEENIAFEDVLQSLEKDRVEAEENKLASEKYKRETEMLKSSLKSEEEKTKAMRDRILNKAREEARDLLRDAKSEADVLVSDLRKISYDVGKERNKQIEEAQKKLKTTLGDVERDLAEDLLNVQSNDVPKDLKKGETVRVLAFNQVGEVLTEPDEKGDLQVQVGIMKITANIQGLKREISREEEKISLKTSHIVKKKSRNIKREIDLRGKNLGEALMEIDKYIDDAYIAGLPEIEIIHGKGTGVLRQGITSYLKSHTHVKEYRLGEYSEGGDGVTIVSLK